MNKRNTYDHADQRGKCEAVFDLLPLQMTKSPVIAVEVYEIE